MRPMELALASSISILTDVRPGRTRPDKSSQMLLLCGTCWAWLPITQNNGYKALTEYLRGTPNPQG
jgi:hypothetical protein